jgi:hypothetical protein
MSRTGFCSAEAVPFGNCQRQRVGSPVDRSLNCARPNEQAVPQSEWDRSPNRNEPAARPVRNLPSTWPLQGTGRSLRGLRTTRAPAAPPRGGSPVLCGSPPAQSARTALGLPAIPPVQIAEARDRRVRTRLLDSQRRRATNLLSTRIKPSNMTGATTKLRGVGTPRAPK